MHKCSNCAKPIDANKCFRGQILTDGHGHLFCTVKCHWEFTHKDKVKGG